MSLTTGINAIDALVYGSWNSAAQQPVSLSYSFLSQIPAGADATDRNGFAPMSTAQQQGVRQALQLWSSVANITFTETASGSGNLQFGTNTQTSSSAYAYLPAPGADTLYMYVAKDAAYNRVFTPGSYGPSVMLHETGHLLGLKHPGNYDSTGESAPGPFLPAATDNGDYTQMSYHDPSARTLTGKYAVTPMLYDIQAIQYLYGANTSYHSGNDTYTFNNTSAPSCIWDAGGVNTFDFSACTGATVINLNAGAFSETSRGLNNVSIAYGVTITGAIAGNGGSTIYANAAGNRISGGNGTDVIYGGAGDDVIAGGAGQDTVVLSGAFSKYVLVNTTAGLSVRGAGADWLTGIEQLRFDDRTVAVSDIALATLGSSGNDLLPATAGPVLDLGDGLDTVSFGGSRAAYQITRDGAAVTVSGGGETHTLLNVERLSFSDAHLALDLDGVAGQMYRLYQTALARTPDAGGLGFWLGERALGASPESVVHSFLASSEFQGRYGALSDADFVTLMYRNALQREPDAGGFAWHLGNLQAGYSREHVLLDFSDSAEGVQIIGATMPVAVLYG